MKNKLPYLYILMGVLSVVVGWQGYQAINFANLFLGGFLIGVGLIELSKKS